MSKAIIAAIIGFIIWTALFLGSNAAISAAAPSAFHADGSTDSVLLLLLILALSILFSLASGWTTARIAGAWALASGFALGLLLLVVGVFVQAQYWHIMPLWYHLSFLIALIPMAMIGARLSRRRVRARI